MIKNKLFTAIAAVMLSAAFALPQIMGINLNVKADETYENEASSDETTIAGEENNEDAIPSFCVIDDILYVAPGVTVDEILSGLEGVSEVITGKDADTPADDEETTEPEEDTSSIEEEIEEANSEDVSEDTSEELSEETTEAEDEALLAGTGMTVIMEDGTVLTIVIMGDLDGDGKITASDARSALRIAVKLDTPTFSQETAGLVKAYIENSDETNEDLTDTDEPGEEEASEAADTDVTDEEETSDTPAEGENEDENSEEPATAITAADARAILRAAVSLENAENWFTAVTTETEKEPGADNEDPSEEESSEEESSSEEENGEE